MKITILKGLVPYDYHREFFLKKKKEEEEEKKKILYMLVGCCVLVARSFAALTIRVGLLEDSSGAAAAWEGGWSCSKCDVGFYI